MTLIYTCISDNNNVTPLCLFRLGNGTASVQAVEKGLCLVCSSRKHLSFYDQAELNEDCEMWRVPSVTLSSVSHFPLPSFQLLLPIASIIIPSISLPVSPLLARIPSSSLLIFTLCLLMRVSLHLPSSQYHLRPTL